MKDTPAYRRQFVRVCACGCGQPTLIAAKTDARTGCVKGQPLRYVFHHFRASRVPLGDRLWGMLEVGDCWEYTGSLRDGYGTISAGGTNASKLQAHRVAWELLVGPIPDGMQLDHLCRNRRCCNPDHLSPVSQLENVRRGYSPSARRARANRCAHGHEYTPGQTYTRDDGSRRCRVCQRLAARRYKSRKRAEAA